MKINAIYACHFNIGEHSGKSRATRQKLYYLSEKLSSLKIISGIPGPKILRVLIIPWLELRVIRLLLSGQYNTYISRGYVGLFSIWLAKRKDIKIVREVHGLESEEKIANPIVNFVFKSVERMLTKVLRSSDLIIVNHESLKNYYKNKLKNRANIKVIYNGFDPRSKSILSKKEARKLYSFSDDIFYISYVGSAHKWHGVESLEYIAEKLPKNIKIVIGGNKVDFQSFHNIARLNSFESADLLIASDALIIPQPIGRTSPGNPLKLYDYFLSENLVIVPRNTIGYSDEAKIYGNYIAVNFNDPDEAVSNIKDYIENRSTKIKLPNLKPFSWSTRMNEWKAEIEKLF